MLLWIFTRNDGTGILDDEHRDGDILQTKPDAFEPSIGGIEKKTYLIIHVPDPPNQAVVESELIKSEYTPGPTSGEPNVVRLKRVFTLDWRNKFTQAEIDIVEDGTQTLVDGQLDSGGNVVAGVVHDKFTVNDLRRK